MILLGVITGLLTALGHSLAYLATRWYTQSRGRSTVRLLVLSYSMIGVLAVAALPVIWPTGLPVNVGWLWPLPLAVACFAGSQTCLLTALRRVDASRVAPLLGVKVAMLAVVASAMGQPLGALQWVGVALAVGSAWLLNDVGGRLPIKATALVLLACLGYAACDTCIVLLIEGAQAEASAVGPGVGPLRASVLAACGVYTGCGLVAVALLPWWGTREAGAWRDALPFTAAWVFAMLTLYASFALVGLVLTAILQSTRGVISIALGVALAAWGHHHLEAKAEPGVVTRRVGAAVLMTAAVALYVLGRSSGLGE